MLRTNGPQKLPAEKHNLLHFLHTGSEPKYEIIDLDIIRGNFLSPASHIQFAEVSLFPKSIHFLC